MNQREAFLAGEGEAWWNRNRDIVDYGDDDLVLRSVERLFTPGSVLEIGCAKGGRLEALYRLTGADCWGVDPAAVTGYHQPMQPRSPITLRRGTADKLPIERTFDIVIFGFCLYLLDRADLFPAVAEADRGLKDGGHLLVYDFWPEQPCSRPYVHCPGLRSFKMDYSKLFLANPAYSLIRCDATGKGGDRVAVHTLKKNSGLAYPVEDP